MDESTEKEFWDKELTKLLIASYKQYPSLYNPEHVEYKHKTLRNVIFDKILKEMQIFKPDVTVENIKKKLRTLQGQISKERVKVLAAQESGTRYTPILWCYNDLLFLSQYTDIGVYIDGYWTRDLTRQLIMLYKSYACSHVDYKNKVKSHKCINCYEAMLEELKVYKPDLTMDAVLKKLRTLRCQMSKERAKILEAKEMGEEYESTLWCYNELLYMDQPSQDPELETEQTDSESSGTHQRVRNILTLEERVRAIEAYDRKPMYTKVANMFNCSWEQIKNVINNRKAILEFYEATKSNSPNLSPDEEDIKRRKIEFLGECIYEYIQRAQFHANAHLTEEIIKAKAIEFRELIQIESFRPNKSWLNQFKISYNISLSQRQIFLTRTPPASLDLKDIMTYCSRNKVAQHTAQEQKNKPLYKLKTSMDIASANSATVEELKQRRQRKINFLEKALYEYIQRSQYHHKMPLNEENLAKIACELKDMLKIDNFYPNKSWFNHFKMHYNFSTSQRTIVFTRTPPLSLDLKDILSYCSRMDQKSANANPTFKQRENIQVAQAPPMVVLPERQQPPHLVTQSVRVLNVGLRPKLNVTVEIEEDIKPNIADIKIEKQETQPVCKPSAEPACAQDSAQRLAPDPTPKSVLDATPKIILEPRQKSVLATVPKPALEPQLKPVLEPKEEPVSDDDEVSPPPLKIQKIEEIQKENNCEQKQPVHSPGHWSEASSDDEELPKHAKSYNDALRLLKPLEEFAMLEENYRAIGLISQLENIFKNPPKPTP